MKGLAERKIQTLKEALSKLQRIDTGQVTLDQMSTLQAALDDTRKAFDRYTEAVDRCQTLEDGEYDHRDLILNREDILFLGPYLKI